MIAQRDSEIAQRDSEIDELQDEALDLYSQARDDDHLRQKIEEQVDVLKSTNDKISDLLKDRSARYAESLEKHKTKHKEAMNEANKKHEESERHASAEVVSLNVQHGLKVNFAKEEVEKKYKKELYRAVTAKNVASSKLEKTKKSRTSAISKLQVR